MASVGGPAVPDIIVIATINSTGQAQWRRFDQSFLANGITPVARHLRPVVVGFIYH